MDNKFLALVLVFFLVFGAFATTMVFNSQNKTIRAAQRTTDASKSLCLVTPLSVKAGRPATVTCILRDEETKSAGSKECCFEATNGTLSKPCVTTNDDGFATTELTRDLAGTAEVSCLTDTNQKINSVSVQFTQ